MIVQERMKALKASFQQYDYNLIVMLHSQNRGNVSKAPSSLFLDEKREYI